MVGVGAKVWRQLEHDIATGQLPPGSRVDVKSVAERFGVSRTPAREALLPPAGAERAALQGAQLTGEGAAGRGDGSAYADANEQFHELIYRGARNDYLHHQIVDLRSRLAFHRPVALAQPERMRASNADHALIVAAILRS